MATVSRASAHSELIPEIVFVLHIPESFRGHATAYVPSGRNGVELIFSLRVKK
jgi:hypothetical protein